MSNSWLDDLPRADLAHLPTPLHLLTQLSDRLGGPKIWLKRDDCTGLGTGGNKTRKLEFLMADARGCKADVVVTFGAVQSNHARQTAAACARMGLECHLILARKVAWPDPGYEQLGNVQLDRLFGAHIHLCAAEEVSACYKSLISDFQDSARTPYVIPTGGSNAIGALGYAACAMELSRQCADLDLPLTDIVHATASAGTQAGLLAGFASLGVLGSTKVHGINVSEADNDEFEQLIFTLANEVLSGNQVDAKVERREVTADPRYLGDGYGIPTQQTLDALRLLGSLEGILFDPVYSGKAMGGLIDRIAQGEFAATQNVVFIHTGGTASLPVYARVL